MFLAVDVGNSNIHAGLFKENPIPKLLNTKAFPCTTKGINQFILYVKNCKSAKGLILSDAYGQTSIADNNLFKQIVKTIPNFVIFTSSIDCGLKINYRPKSSLGTDRIANCVAAHALYKTNCLVIDFGTATTFNVVTKHGEFLGGLITPGIQGLINALPIHLKMKDIELKNIQPNLLAQTTLQSLHSGLYYWAINAITQIKCDMEKYLKTKLFMIATGGGINLIPNIKNIFNNIDANLTLKGLAIIYQNIKGVSYD